MLIYVSTGLYVRLTAKLQSTTQGPNAQHLIISIRPATTPLHTPGSTHRPARGAVDRDAARRQPLPRRRVAAVRLSRPLLPFVVGWWRRRGEGGSPSVRPLWLVGHGLTCGLETKLKELEPLFTIDPNQQTPLHMVGTYTPATCATARRCSPIPHWWAGASILSTSTRTFPPTCRPIHLEMKPTNIYVCRAGDHHQSSEPAPTNDSYVVFNIERTPTPATASRRRRMPLG